ncbi:MAG: PilZ domain-containing protein [Defluviitaleaceae bacterium]|nr:PilZ domain-containing protein [Defluviitaleaceae bacterium]MCL2275417.1 PilZ domain-containing protein [Defluviitaleaceae bacterium]
MDFRFIDDGTQMDIRQKNADDTPTYYSTFEKIVRGATFHVTCDPLYERFDELDLNNIYVFTFYRGADAFTFDAKLTERLADFHHQTLVFTATTIVSSYSRRSAHRLQIQMPVRVYEKDETKPEQRGSLFCEGVMYDISRGGLTFLSSERLKLELRSVYIAEYEINKILFRMPVEFVRVSERGLSPIYRFDYAFMYSGGEAIKEELNRMTLALFEHQLKGGR